MRAAIVIVAVVVVVACTGAEPDVQRVSFGPIELALPAGWTPSPKAEQRVMWTPSDNARKESLVLGRTPPREVLAKAGHAAMREIERFLADAQAALPGAVFTAPTQFTTPSGMPGVRIEGDFVPAGQHTRYRRIHAVVVDGAGDGALLHVIYTAAHPDSQPMKIVLDSLRKGA